MSASLLQRYAVASGSLAALLVSSLIFDHLAHHNETSQITFLHKFPRQCILLVKNSGIYCEAKKRLKSQDAVPYFALEAPSNQDGKKNVKYSSQPNQL